MHRVRTLALSVAILVALGAGHALAQQAPAAGEHAQPAEAAAHEIHLIDFFWPVVNFAILCGVLYYFLKSPLLGYLANRGENLSGTLGNVFRPGNLHPAHLQPAERFIHVAERQCGFGMGRQDARAAFIRSKRQGNARQ